MVEQLTDRVWRLDLGQVNAFLVDDDRLTLVDAGTPGSADDIVAGISEAGFDVVDVERVLLTHYDFDHVGALSKLTPDLKAPVYAADPDAAWLAGETTPPIGKIKGIVQRVSDLLVTLPDLPIKRVVDGDTVGGFTAYHTPGHNPGHVAFVNGRLGVGMLGDLVRVSDGRMEPSPWFLSYDTNEVTESIETLAGRAPSFEVACVGHGDPVTENASGMLVKLARNRG